MPPLLGMVTEPVSAVSFFLWSERTSRYLYMDQAYIVNHFYITFGNILSTFYSSLDVVTKYLDSLNNIAPSWPNMCFP